MPQPEMITTRTAAVILRTNTRAVTRMVHRGELKPTMTAPLARYGAFFFARADVEALATARQAAR